MRTLLKILLVAFVGITVANVKASDDSRARTPQDDSIDGFKTKAELDASLKASDPAATPSSRLIPLESRVIEKEGCSRKGRYGSIDVRL